MSARDINMVQKALLSLCVYFESGKQRFHALSLRFSADALY